MPTSISLPGSLPAAQAFAEMIGALATSALEKHLRGQQNGVIETTDSFHFDHELADSAIVDPNLKPAVYVQVHMSIAARNLVPKGKGKTGSPNDGPGGGPGGRSPKGSGKGTPKGSGKGTPKAKSNGKGTPKSKSNGKGTPKAKGKAKARASSKKQGKKAVATTPPKRHRKYVDSPDSRKFIDDILGAHPAVH